MTHPFVIAPSILAADFSRLGQEIAACEAAGADWIHVDVMDGHFVPNLTVGPVVVEACRRVTKLPLDVHLMIEKPERLLDVFAHAGASHLTVHVETCPHLPDTLQQIRSLGVKAGVTLNPATPAAMIEPVLNMVELVLVMTVNPGFSGQNFIPEVLSKVAQIRKLLDGIGSSARLEVDGGVSETTLPALIAAGADTFVAGNAIFHHPSGIAAGVAALRSAFPIL
ncbi:MAG: ribulose-phosphate 3-epimerase [Anaerolineales bacterium]